ncbi:hypothetical protein CRENBAI_015085 [Crenichthys baileyi]|uniref:Uncharacterized protein n=1 Tax=Crenichthys baileyi TaxID=28760 RepID=A0AAV9QTQ6_9TELE
MITRALSGAQPVYKLSSAASPNYTEGGSSSTFSSLENDEGLDNTANSSSVGGAVNWQKVGPGGLKGHDIPNTDTIAVLFFYVCLVNIKKDGRKLDTDNTAEEDLENQTKVDLSWTSASSLTGGPLSLNTQIPSLLSMSTRHPMDITIPPLPAVPPEGEMKLSVTIEDEANSSAAVPTHPSVCIRSSLQSCRSQREC